MNQLDSDTHAVIESHKEQACCFQSGCTLTGVYTPAKNTGLHSPCALFITAGLLHHVGPTRLYVELARSLSEQDVAGFRFDLSGAGDSETGSLGGYFMDRSVQEIKDAMTFIQNTYGHQQFVLVGLCSGADDALATAQQDDRVAGLVLLNSYAYRAGWFHIHRLIKFYLPRIVVWSKLKNGAMRLLTRTDKAQADSTVALNKLDEDFRYVPPKAETQAALRSLCQVNTNMLFVYTGSEHEEYTYPGQLFAMFPALKGQSCVQERYIPEADHTYILVQDRRKLIRWVGEWFVSTEFQRTSNTIN